MDRNTLIGFGLLGIIIAGIVSDPSQPVFTNPRRRKAAELDEEDEELEEDEDTDEEESDEDADFDEDLDYGMEMNPAPKTPINIDVLEELGDKSLPLGRVAHPPKGLSEDATYVVLVNEDPTWTIVLFDDEERYYKKYYANIPNRKLARQLGEALYADLNHHARFGIAHLKEEAKLAAKYKV